MLIVGPWLGEFGWEVSRFVPAARYAAKGKEVIVICRSGHEYLYRDFCHTFYNDDRRGNPDRWLLDGKKLSLSPTWKGQFPDAKFFKPRKKTCMTKKLEFVKYGTKLESHAYDLVIHARAETKYGQGKLNYDPKKYAKIVKKLGVNACSVGTKAYHVEGTEDLRKVPLARLCSVLASSKVCLGTSSGTMHLASFCGCPHIVLTDNQPRKILGGKTNRDRYKTMWNPFGTKCSVLDKDNWHPPVKKVLKVLEGF